MLNIKFASKIFIGLMSLSAASSALGSDVLDQFYKTTHTIAADFEQTVSSTDGKLIEQSQGHLKIKRPDKFFLEYTAPLEQKYISNGQTLWVFDAELEQVTIKPVDEGLGDSPALLISSDKDIRKNYQVKTLAAQPPLERVELTARNENMTFERVILGFNKTILTEMLMYDSFNQVTRLKLSDIKINQSFTQDVFNFIPPEGVDVIGQEK